MYSLFLSLFFGLIFIFLKKSKEKTDIYNKILTVLIGFIILPFFISIPYYFSIYNISFVDSLFESISGFTSTGFSIFNNIKNLDESIILWRSSSQWIGGLYFLFSLIFLIDIFESNQKRSLTNFLTFNTSETLKQYMKTFILYIFLTFFIFIFLYFFKIRTFDSFNLSMSLISSGGFLPVNELGEILTTKPKQIALSLTMLVSFFSLYFTYNLLNLKKNINFFQEDFYLSVYLFFLCIIFFILFKSEYNFSIIFLSIISSISNIGFSIDSSYTNTKYLFLILSIIGGSFFSNSSGLKFIKLYILFKFSVNELISHARPKNVYIIKLFLSNLKYNISDIHKFFLSLLIFILLLIILTSFLTISGVIFEESFKLSILTLTNTVNSHMHGLNQFNFEDLSYLNKYILMIFMIIGKVEFLTILILIKKIFFKN